MLNSGHKNTYLDRKLSYDDRNEMETKLLDRDFKTDLKTAFDLSFTFAEKLASLHPEARRSVIILLNNGI